jgi:hypothetical protein
LKIPRQAGAPRSPSFCTFFSVLEIFAEELCGRGFQPSVSVALGFAGLETPPTKKFSLGFAGWLPFENLRHPEICG